MDVRAVSVVDSLSVLIIRWSLQSVDTDDLFLALLIYLFDATVRINSVVIKRRSAGRGDIITLRFHRSVITKCP